MWASGPNSVPEQELGETFGKIKCSNFHEKYQIIKSLLLVEVPNQYIVLLMHIYS